MHVLGNVGLAGVAISILHKLKWKPVEEIEKIDDKNGICKIKSVRKRIPPLTYERKYVEVNYEYS